MSLRYKIVNDLTLKIHKWHTLSSTETSLLPNG